MSNAPPSTTSITSSTTLCFSAADTPARLRQWSAHSPEPRPTLPPNGAIIDPGNCLDLAEESGQELVKVAFEGLRLLHGSSGEPMPINEPGHKGGADLVKRHLDCAVLNFLHQTRLLEDLPAYDTVRAPFFEGGALFDGSKLSEKSHIQWCVRDPKQSIIAYFRPRDPKATEA